MKKGKNAKKNIPGHYGFHELIDERTKSSDEW